MIDNTLDVPNWRCWEVPEETAWERPGGSFKCCGEGVESLHLGIA